jgi:hypothetical protein
MRDTIPNRAWQNERAVVNLQPQSSDGSHWVCYNKKGSCVHYFDSFGDLRAPPELQRYLKGCTIFYNTKREQSFDSVVCGHLCLRFLCT